MTSLFNKLRYTVDILGADATTVVLSGVAAGFEELGGRELKDAQSINSETQVLVTVRWDATITASCFVRFEGALYPILYKRDPGKPNPVTAKGEVSRGMLLELYAHRQNEGL